MRIPFLLRALAILALLASNLVHAFDVRIDDESSQRGSWQGNTWVPSDADSVVSHTEVSTRLGTAT